MTLPWPARRIAAACCNKSLSGGASSEARIRAEPWDAMRSIAALLAFASSMSGHTGIDLGHYAGGEPLDLFIHFGDGVRRKHQGAAMVDADRPQLVDLLQDDFGRPDQIGNHLMTEIAAGIGQRAPMRHQAARHVALFRSLEGFVHGDRKLRRNLD